MSNCTTKMWGMSGDPLEDTVLAVGRMRPNLGLPVAEIGGLLPGRAIDHLSRVTLVDREIPRHGGYGRMLQPVANAGSDAGNLEDGRDVLLVIDPIEIRLEVLRDVHLHDIDIRHWAFLLLDGARRLGETRRDHEGLQRSPQD